MKRRGLALVEVIAALALLAALAGVVVPLLQTSARALEPAAKGAGLVRLSEFADHLLADPQAFGFSEEALAIERLDAVLTSPGGAPIRITRLESAEKPSDHAWLIFDSEGAAVARWIFVDRRTSR